MRRGRYVIIALLWCVAGMHTFGMCAELKKNVIGYIFSGDPGEEFCVSPNGRWLASVASLRAEPVMLFDVTRGTKLSVRYIGDLADLSMANQCTAAWQNDHNLTVLFSSAAQQVVLDVEAGGAEATACRIQEEDPQRFFSGRHKNLFGTTIRTPDGAVTLSDSPLRNGAFGMSVKEADGGRSLYLFYRGKKIATYLQTTGFLSFQKPILDSVSVPVFVWESRGNPLPTQGIFYTISWVNASLRKDSTDLYYFSIKDKKVTLVDRGVQGLLMWAPDARTFFYAKKNAGGGYQVTAVLFQSSQG